MKRNSLNFLLLVASIVMMGVSGNRAWNDMPAPIVKIVSEYFPDEEVASFVESPEGGVVKTVNGGEFAFDSDYRWVKVANGVEPLPQDFVCDQLPSELYEYYVALEGGKDVYSVSWEGDVIMVKFHDSTVAYDAVTGSISYPGYRLQGEL